MIIGERIKLARKNLHMTQEDFGNRLGIARNTIASYEIGRRDPMEQTIKSICREFNISYMWLKDGVGEMFNSADTEVTALFDRILAGENETAKAVFKAFAKLNEEDWKVIGKIIDEIKK